MKRVVALISAFAALTVWASGGIIVVDAVDSEPLVGATVFSSNGTIAGVTDINGKIDNAAASDYPLTVRCIGYENATAFAEADTLRMSPATYALKEVTVSPAGRPVTNMLCYVREYMSGATTTDTIQLFAEYMCEFFLTDTKVKGFGKGEQSPTFLRRRCISRSKGADGRDSVAQKFDEELFSWAQLLRVGGPALEEPEPIAKGASTHIKPGKFSDAIKFHKTATSFSRNVDGLADHKDHHWEPVFFKILGFTIDCRELIMSESYAVNGTGSYTYNDLKNMTVSIRMIGKGKWFKKALRSKEPVELSSFIELYPVEIVHLTPEEAREMKKTVADRIPHVKFVRDGIPPLAPSVQRLVDMAADQ